MRAALPGWMRAAVLLLGLAAGAARGAGNEALLRRAEAGDAEAQFDLGRRHLLGQEGTRKDAAEAVRWFRRAAEQGHERSQLNLSNAYAEGRGVDRDEGAAVDWLLKAAEGGQARAMVLLGERFLEGRGVAQSPLLAYVWISRAAVAGSPLGQLRKAQVHARLSEEERTAAGRLERVQRERTRRLKMTGSTDPPAALPEAPGRD